MNHSLLCLIKSVSQSAPEISLGRSYFTFTGTAGLIVTTLALTYILQVYTALQDRDSLGLEMHLLTDQTNDVAELLAGLGAHGHMHTGYTELGNAAAQLSATDQTYHHYPLLFFFRFEEPYYAVSSIALLAFDAASLSKSGLDDERAWCTMTACSTSSFATARSSMDRRPRATAPTSACAGIALLRSAT
jgi:hypothetical protein